jgi:formyltetrahydrofolate deformylase
MTDYLLTLSCRNMPGIVAAVSAAVFLHGGNINEASQYDEALADRFFMRLVFSLPEEGEQTLRRDLEAVAKRFGMEWTLRPRARAAKGAAVGQPFRSLSGRSALPAAHGGTGDGGGGGDLQSPALGFERAGSGRYLVSPFTNHAGRQIRAGGAHQGDRHPDRRRSGRAGALHADPVRRSGGVSGGRCINIHHSFLPGFKGAKPYHQAHERGVKLIGATAHYVTRDLDEGPIIEQDVERISHADRPEDLVRKGRDIERRVLARAVRLHLDGRSLLHGNKTVVFRD